MRARDLCGSDFKGVAHSQDGQSGPVVVAQEDVRQRTGANVGSSLAHEGNHHERIPQRLYSCDCIALIHCTSASRALLGPACSAEPGACQHMTFCKCAQEGERGREQREKEGQGSLDPS